MLVVLALALALAPTLAPVNALRHCASHRAHHMHLHTRDDLAWAARVDPNARATLVDKTHPESMHAVCSRGGIDDDFHVFVHVEAVECPFLHRVPLETTLGKLRSMKCELDIDVPSDLGVDDSLYAIPDRGHGVFYGDVDVDVEYENGNDDNDEHVLIVVNPQGGPHRAFASLVAARAAARDAGVRLVVANPHRAHHSHLGVHALGAHTIAAFASARHGGHEAMCVRQAMSDADVRRATTECAQDVRAERDRRMRR